MDPITTVIADDHPIIRSGLRADLGDDFTIVGEADNATDTIRLIETLHPNLLVCDVHMPGGGLSVAARCGDITNVVMFSVSNAERDVLDAVAAGAIGYLRKDTHTSELRDALRRAATGQPVLPPDLAMLVFGEFRRLAKTATGQNPLSKREREVLTEVAKGRPYADIADTLFISARTVETHVRNILDKLHLERRDELIAYAQRHDIR